MAQSDEGARDSGPLASAVLTVALWMSLWIISGSLLVVAVDEPGPHPARRMIVGLLLLLGTLVALWQRERFSEQARRRPWIVLLLAAAQLCAAAIDGLLPAGPYVAFSLTSVVIAVIVAHPRTVWLTVVLLVVGLAAAAVIEESPAGLARSGDLDGVLGAMLGYPFVAALGIGMIALFRGMLVNVEPLLDEMRRGGPVLTPALAEAIREGGRGAPERLLLPPPPPIRLTPREARVVDGLARGKAPKQLAYEWGISLATVRTHIKHAKAKTGARTLPELAAFAVALEASATRDDDG